MTAGSGTAPNGVAFGPLLRSLRCSAGWTQEELAERSGLSVRAISDCERGRIRRPQRRSTAALATALGLGGSDLEEFVRAARGGPRPAPPAASLPRPPAPYIMDRAHDGGGEAEEGGERASARPAEDPPATAHPWPPAGPLVSAIGPAQLPRLPAGLVGRARELAALSDAASGPGGVCTVTGPAGVGKTSLALWWAHGAAAAFPDGQLFADLRGFSEDDPADSAAVLQSFLAALGLPRDAVPGDVTAAQALYRSALAGRRVLVVLDNACGSEQVRPLLPGSAGCAVVVTSRHRLQGLAARDGARTLTLDVLDGPESLRLLTAVLGEERIARAPAAARALADACGGLPLALRIVAARLTSHPTWPLEALAAELADERHRLTALSAEDTDVVAALRLSVRALPAPVEPVFALFGLHPGLDLEAHAVAAALESSPATAQQALDHLASAHLVQEWVPGRYACHDLVRLYARRYTSGARSAEALRLLDHYLHAAYAASRAADPAGRPCCDLPAWSPPPSVRPPSPTTHVEAMRWYHTEADNLQAMVQLAHSLGDHRHAWRLTVLLWPLMTSQSHRDWTPLLARGLAAAEAVADPVARSRILVLLGWALTENGRCDEAVSRLRQAVELTDRTGDRCDQATAVTNLGLALARLGRSQEALTHYDRARSLAQQIGDRRTIALALAHSAQLHLTLGSTTQALDRSRKGLELGGTTPLGGLETLLLEIAGTALCDMGRTQQGLALLRRALLCAESEQNILGEANVLDSLALALDRTGSPQQAGEYRDRARTLRSAIRGPAQATAHVDGVAAGKCGEGLLNGLVEGDQALTERLVRAAVSRRLQDGALS
ncbi:ATP-binding protein [Streptomyces sp. NPDC002867]